MENSMKTSLTQQSIFATPSANRLKVSPAYTRFSK